MNQVPDYEAIKRFSADIRINTIKSIHSTGSGHIGGSASIADVLAVLYGGMMRVDPKNPKWAERDWLVLSKGHCGPALYATLALKGYFPMDWLTTLNKPNTNLPSHADANRTPGVDMSTGSLGQGISAAVGIALGNRTQKIDSYTYCIVGDGELNEGEVWEACSAATDLKLDNLIVFVDWNKKQLDGRLEEILEPGDISKKFEVFGFDVQTVVGYDYQAIWEAIEKAKSIKGKPSVIILDTIKGLGVKLAEEKEFNHHLPITDEGAEEAIAEIERRLSEGTYPVGDFKW
ncbi:MAG TPA: transketolase [Clostridiaceae bacterium]|nr:transketolase [Clostridiaceae bacterium]